MHRDKFARDENPDIGIVHPGFIHLLHKNCTEEKRGNMLIVRPNVPEKRKTHSYNPLPSRTKEGLPVRVFSKGPWNTVSLRPFIPSERAKRKFRTARFAKNYGARLSQNGDQWKVHGDVGDRRARDP